MAAPHFMLCPQKNPKAENIHAEYSENACMPCVFVEPRPKI